MRPEDEITQSERRDVMQSDRKATTYLAQAIAEETSQGRFAHLSKATVTGSTPSPWPRLPANNPWASADPTGQEPPLGYEIHSQEPVGTPVEVQRSIAASSSSRMGDDAPRPSSLPVSPSGVGDGRVTIRRRI
jgi:hypothetical protein